MRRAIKIAGTLIPIFTTTGVSTTFLIKSGNDNKKQPGENHEVSISDDMPLGKVRIFPEIFQQNYYDDIHVLKGEPYITDDMIAKIVKDVLKGATYSGGQIKWAYEFKDNTKQEVKITFEWLPDISVLSKVVKTYIVKINK